MILILEQLGKYFFILFLVHIYFSLFNKQTNKQESTFLVQVISKY